MANKHNRGIVLTNIFGIVLNVILVGVKVTVGFLISSASIITDGLNNFADSLNSLISIIGTKLSGKRPTKKHPFGFGRFEYLTSSIIGIIVLVVGIVAIRDSIESIVEYYTTWVLADFKVSTLIIIGVAIVVKLIMSLVYRIMSKKYDSDTLKALSTDSFFDSLLSTATLISAIVGMVWHFYIEGYVGILIGGFIIKSGIEIIVEAMSHLLGKRVDDEFASQIKSDIASVEGVHGVYDLILNNYGYGKFIGSVHVGVRNDLDVHQVQELEREIAMLLYEKHKIIMTVGVYAQNKESKESKAIFKKVSDLIALHPAITQIHGFFFDEKDAYVSFDLVFSFEEKDPEKVVNEFNESLTKDFPQYRFIINIDHDYA